MAMKRVVVALMVALLAVGFASARKGGASFPFDPKEAVLVSHPDNLMSHTTSTVIRKNGDVFVGHIRDQKHNHEDGKSSSIEVVISKFNLKNLKAPRITYTTVMSVGGQLGSFKQSDTMPTRNS